jgi:methylmalonyl-CoA/ethylmalonyl-CoA epimerase
VKGLKYLGLATNDIGRAARQFQQIGLRCSDFYVLPKASAACFIVSLGNVLLEVLTPLGPAPTLRSWLEQHPNGGVHHLGLTVRNLDIATAALRGRGAALEGDGHPIPWINGNSVAFIRPPGRGPLLALEQELEGRPAIRW